MNAKIVISQLSVFAMVALYTTVSEARQFYWQERIGPTNAEFWKACKTGAVVNLLPKAGESTGDVATNVKALQDNKRSSGRDLVYVTYDAETEGSPVNVSMTVVDYNTGEAIDAHTFLSGSDIGLRVPEGKGKLIIWDVGTDYKQKYSEKMKVNVVAVPADNPETWAIVTISWAAFGGRDLDVCGYWVDRPDVKVGWSYSTGSTDSAYRSTWRGDNTGSGPEYINIGVVPGEMLDGVVDRRYRVHCNYYGSAGNACKATITVTCGGISKSKTITVSNRNGNKALTSDPCVTISFSDNGELLSVN